MMYSLYVISNKPEKFDAIVESLTPCRVSYFDGAGYKSFSKLVNSCVAQCPTETIIIMSDKVLPTAEHVKRTLDLLQLGYAFVALYRFAFFGFKKELMRRIGMIDENYVGGGYEDDDFYARLVEQDLPLYITHDVPYTAAPSSWNADRAREYHFSKWQFDGATHELKRNKAEPKLNYDLGPSIPTTFLPSKEFSYTPLPQVAQYFYLNINKK